MLSGLALQPIAELVEGQLAWLPDGARLRKALASCDWAVLKDRLGVSCAYMEDAARRPSGLDMFKRLAARAPGARFHVFQGTQDRNTPVEPVRALEAWNASSGHLPIAFHYYEGITQEPTPRRLSCLRCLRRSFRRSEALCPCARRGAPQREPEHRAALVTRS